MVERIHLWWEALDDHDRRYFRMGAKLFVAIILVWGGFWVGLRVGFGEITDAGEFGDMFGAVNALFSGLAFAGVIIAILLQREELRLQRQELQDTRQTLARSAAAQEESVDLLKKQLSLQERGMAAAAAPMFRLQGSIGWDEARLNFRLRNMGDTTVRELQLATERNFGSRAGEGRYRISPDDVLRPQEEAEVCYWPPEGIKPSQVTHLQFVMTLLDAQNESRLAHMELINGTVRQRYP